MNGSTAMANLRKRRTFYVSYGILTDERNSYVVLKRSTDIRLRTNGNERWKPRITLIVLPRQRP